MGAEGAQRAPKAWPGVSQSRQQSQAAADTRSGVSGGRSEVAPLHAVSSTFSMVLRFAQGPAGPSRLQSKPKPEHHPCHRVYALAWVSWGLQTGKTDPASPCPSAATSLGC